MTRSPGDSGDRILLAHGAGGSLMHRLIRELLLKYLDSPELAPLDDAAELRIEGDRLAFSTDSFVVKPLFFPGGDIGSLAVSGTVNDLLMKGARPAYLSLGLVLEEGLPIADLARILESIQRTSQAAEVSVVTGDTKVVPRGEADGVFINTAGIGSILPETNVGGSNARPGDAVIVSGGIGEHGIAVMTERNGLKLGGDIASDAAPLNRVVLPILERFGGAVHVLRDPTRGGVAASLNEIADASHVEIALEESAVPVREQVNAVCELLGFDPLYVPCEGRFLAVVDGAVADGVVELLRAELDCPLATRIGEVSPSDAGLVQLHTTSGGRRILDMPAGELLPRIC
ncbi:MAG: hydrogenase expression/formation protein HypE [Planctomycetales bacterium 4484_113]|nr:MAG: hydrogenase expression/formation protein HypE [Planctomycetales bacterium 4484_113]RLI47571.1 MAG: hydrogenase expression/formation protein HypE [Candidatus Thorarchaeota archaeon]